ncbi:MAG TPA: condensation domain-containing protein, partial [Candidatus Nanopelagicales bacterium]|nr:condensation domain-containing protein [Candidatus Nanopelagicales bacterium]
GRLRLDLGFSAAMHAEQTISMLSAHFIDALRAIIAHCLSPEAGGYTPSDFSLARLDQSSIDRLVGAGRDVEDVYRLSPMQHGMLLHTLREPGSGVYFNQLCCGVRGKLDAASFQSAWRAVAQRHAILRTSFHWEGLEEPVQIVHRSAAPPVREVDWRALAREEQEARLEAYLFDDRQRGFDLSEAPLFRLLVARRADDAWDLVFSHHHLLLDGWSLPLLLKDVFATYDALRRGAPPPLDPARPYRDYISWLDRQDPSRAEPFWRGLLRGFTAPTSLPIVRASAAAGETRDHRVVETSLSPGATARLQMMARRHRLTLNTIAEGAWAILLARYAREDSVVFGAVVSGRPADLRGSDAMVGLFVNTLPVRVAVSGGESLVPWLERLQAQQVEMRQYEYSTLAGVQAMSEVPRGQALFDTLLVFENYPVDESLRAARTDLELRDVRTIERTNYAILIEFIPRQELTLKLGYDAARLEEGAGERLLDHLRTLLEGIAEEPERAISALPWVPAEERRRLLVDWNDTQVDAPEGCVHALFEAQVERTPEAVALVSEHRRLSYRELDQHANRLAHHLRAMGVGPETLVGVSMERTPEMVIALLGILKAGGAYVPLDPAYPRERLEFMLEDTRAPVVVTQS